MVKKKNKQFPPPPAISVATATVDWREEMRLAQLTSKESIRQHSRPWLPYYPGCRVYLVSSGTAVKGIVLAIIHEAYMLVRSKLEDPYQIQQGFYINWDFNPADRREIGQGKAHDYNEITLCSQQLSIEERLTHWELLVQQYAQRELQGQLTNV